MKNTYDTVVKPVISEKSFKDAGRGQYSFIVDRRATKGQIKDAIEKLFAVDVVRVTTTSTQKNRNVMTRNARRTVRKTEKKARVQLKKGQKIDMFEEEAI